MKLASIGIENFRAIEKLDLALDPRLTVLHGANAHGKTSVLGAIAAGLGAVPYLLSGVFERGFLDTDLRVGALDLRVALTTVDGISWSGMVTKGSSERRGHTRALKDKADEVFSDCNEGRPVEFPIVAFYDTDRVIFDLTERWSDFKKEFTRYDAFKGALSSRTNFQGIFEWFYFKENEELREQRERRDFGYQLRDLSSVRHAISSMLGDVSEPHMEMDPPRFMVTIETGRKSEKLALDQLSEAIARCSPSQRIWPGGWRKGIRISRIRSNPKRSSSSTRSIYICIPPGSSGSWTTSPGRSRTRSSSSPPTARRC